MYTVQIGSGIMVAWSYVVSYDMAPSIIDLKTNNKGGQVGAEGAKRVT